MIGIVVPVYYEDENIENLLNEIERKIKNSKKVFIVYDVDEDPTVPVVFNLIDSYSFEIKLVKNKYGRGVAKAIKTGLEISDTDAVLVIMADLSDDLSIVDRMYEMIKNGYDIVCGSRYMKGGKQIGGPLIKKTISRLAGLSLYYLTAIPTHDITNSFKMYNKSFLNQIRIESDGGFEIGMEICVKAFVMGRKIGEIPSIWRDRTKGKSKFKILKWLPKYLKWYFYAFRKFLK
jgi:glycosyltransferase involved in cell wall biosynthesis